VAPTPSGSGWSLTRVEGQADPDVLEQRLRVVLLTHADALGQLVERIDRPDLGFSVRQSALKELLELMEEPPFSAGLVQGRLPQPGHDRGRLHNLVWHLRRNGH
jgi:hypothetical protein